MTDVSSTPIDPSTGLPVVGAPAAFPLGAPAAPAPVAAAPAAPADVPATPTAEPAPVAAAPAPVPAAPTTADLLAAITALTDQVNALKAQAPASSVPDVPSVPVSPVNLYETGQPVRYAWNDPYDGPSERFGIVIELLEDEGTGNGAQSRLAWLTGGTSGPLGDHLLTAV